MGKVSSTKKMSLTFGSRQKRDISVCVPKINRPKEVVMSNLPITGGNGLGGYVLDVMTLN